jgi:hypothetical protein
VLIWIADGLAIAD